MTVIDINSRANPEREKDKLKMAENVLQGMIDTDDDGGPDVVSFAMQYASKEDLDNIDKWIWKKVREEPEDSDPVMYNLLIKAVKETIDMGELPCKK